ncbi:unnamed protein product [Brassica oleracea var. botrytis]
MRCWFEASVILGRRASLTISGLSPGLDLKRLSKYSIITLEIPLSVKIGSPSEFSITEKLLIAFLPLVILWKYPEFLSPRLSHKFLLLCFQ